MRSPPGLERIFLLLKHDTISVPFLFIKDNANRLRTVAHFINFKKTFRNGIIYKYKNCSKYHEQKLGLSRNTIKKLISQFIELGWAEKKGELVFLKGKSSLAESEYGSLKLIRIQKDTDVLTQLQYVLIKSKINQINYRISRKEALQKSIRRKFLKILKESYTRVPCKTVANIFNCSKSTATNILKKSVKKNLLKVKKSEKQFLGFCSFTKWLHKELWWDFKEPMCNCFIYKGKIYALTPNQYMSTI